VTTTAPKRYRIDAPSCYFTSFDVQIFKEVQNLNSLCNRSKHNEVKSPKP